MFKKVCFLILGLILGFTLTSPTFASGGSGSPPTVSSPTFADVTATTATLGGNVTSDGGKSISDRGVEWGTSPGSYPNSVSENGTSTGVFTVGVTGLPGGTTIYFRAWAINARGTSVSAESSFTTISASSAPTLDSSTLGSLAGVTSSTATLDRAFPSPRSSGRLSRRHPCGSSRRPLTILQLLPETTEGRDDGSGDGPDGDGAVHASPSWWNTLLRSGVSGRPPPWILSGS